MLTKGQKIYMYLCAIVSMLIAIVTFIPFRTLPFMCTLSNVNDVVTAEMVIKLIVFPIVIIALSIFANVKKYHEIRDGLDRSKIVNVMSYYPIISYLASIIASIIHTLSYSYEPIGFNIWGVVIILLVIYLFLVGLTFHFISKIVIRFDVIGSVVFDSVLMVITLCFVLVSWRTTTSYLNTFGNVEEFVGHGDVILFCAYVLALVAAIVHCYALVKLIKKDNRSIYVNRDMFEKNYDRIIKREYARAYNDILDDFEIYFAEHGDETLELKEETTETSEEVDTKEETTETSEEVDPKEETTETSEEVDAKEETTETSEEVDPKEETTETSGEVDPKEETTETSGEVGSEEDAEPKVEEEKKSDEK